MTKWNAKDARLTKTFNRNIALASNQALTETKVRNARRQRNRLTVNNRKRAQRALARINS